MPRTARRFLQVVSRWAWCMACACIYQLLTNPLLISVFMVLPYLTDWLTTLPFLQWYPWQLAWEGNWKVAAAVMTVWTAPCLLAALFAQWQKSPFSGEQILTAPKWLWIFGDDQLGYAPQWFIDKHPKWPQWLRSFDWCWERNKLRNLPFVSWLKWLHRKPDKLLIFDIWNVRGFRIELWYQGWMTELKWSKGNRFGDIGPRLDQPDQWDGVSWAFRPFGKM